MNFYVHFTLAMDRSPGFGSTSCNYSPYSDSLSLRLRSSQILTSLHNVTRRSVLQKVHGRAFNALPLLVNTGFQVLFHSPPGVLFTFPSRYYALSVTKSYLALGGGPPCFPPDSSCLAVLWIQPRFRPFVYGTFTLFGLWCNFPVVFYSSLRSLPLSTTPRSKLLGLGSFPFARRYLGNRCFFLFLPVLRCFSSRSSLLQSYVFTLR